MDNKIEQIDGVIGSRGSWPVAEPGGELVLIDVPGRPGAKQKMNKAEAIRLGLWKEPEQEARDKTQDAGAEGKMQGLARNKARRPTPNKAA